ncbi:hypothetical protein F5879DRAFT_995058, partial [Lentinula edodes]
MQSDDRAGATDSLASIVRKRKRSVEHEDLSQNVVVTLAGFEEQLVEPRDANCRAGPTRKRCKTEHHRESLVFFNGPEWHNDPLVENATYDLQASPIVSVTSRFIQASVLPSAGRNRESDQLSSPLQTRPAELPLQDLALLTPVSVSSSWRSPEDVARPLPITISLPLGTLPAVSSPQDVVTHTPTELSSPQYVAHTPPSSPPPPPSESSSTTVNHSVPSYSQPRNALL